MLKQILSAQSHDPFAFLGKHPHEKKGIVIRVFHPRAASIMLVPQQRSMTRTHDDGLFEIHLAQTDINETYRLSITDHEGNHWEEDDSYRFSTFLTDFDLHLINEGNHLEAYRLHGAHVREIENVQGVGFAVWAPSATRVSVVGNFNHWDGRQHQMRARGNSGMWELFIPNLCAGETYKYEVRTQSGDVLLKTDPYAQQMEYRPDTASIVHDEHQFDWQDQTWLNQREHCQTMSSPITTYEVHLGSWRKLEDGSYMNYRQIAHELVEYCQWMGYTHIELLPIMEHPFDGSWGYQVVGYYAPTSRFGSPDDFKYFVNYCHEHGLGVFLDWVPAHFPKDSHGLARFDGTALYEHEDPRLGEHRDWGTLIFNFGRNEVRNFLIANALFWIEQYHIDGLRVDAVASMLYLDYSREADQWIPNKHGGRENLEAVAFMQQMNTLLHEKFPGVLTMAEESTSWPMVSRPTYLGGLGFTRKWNMGWMNDTLSYFEQDPVYRQYHHNQMTFSQIYAYTENFMLPFSHDEVVHGKGSMITKQTGDAWQKFANLRLLYAWQMTHPGNKLLFMGCEFAQTLEWNENTSLSWHETHDAKHRGIQMLVRDLNNVYQNYPSLHELDFEQQGFAWVDCNDTSHSTLSFIRRGKSQHEHLLIVLNMTPVPRSAYRLGVPNTGFYKEIFNSDAAVYGGSNMGNQGGIEAVAERHMEHENSIVLTLPPLAALILQWNDHTAITKKH